MSKHLIKRIILSFVGVMIISMAVAIFRLIDLGTDPFTCFNLGISYITGTSFGNIQVIDNLILLAVLAWFGLKYFGIGTVFSMFLVGYVSDFMLQYILTSNGSAYPFLIRLVLLVVGLLVISFGVALYSTANLGISPYDAFSFIVDDKTNGRLPFKYVRIVLDVSLVVVGYFLGSVVGIGTVVIALGTGPCVAWLLEKCVRPVFGKNL